MKLTSIKDPWISKEKFDYVLNVKNRVSREKWIEFINMNNDYFTWVEDTQEGRRTLENIDNVPENFREGELIRLNKSQALAEYNQAKKYFEVVIDFNNKIGIISTTFTKPINRNQIVLLLRMANYLDAFLLNNGTQVIDEKLLANLT